MLKKKFIKISCFILFVVCLLVLSASFSFAGEGEKDITGFTKELPLWSVIPFALLLMSIALIPLFYGHWWESNKNKGIIAFILSLPILIYFIVWDYHHLIHAGLEYFSFIVLLGALFTISGGIVLTGDIRATPFINTMFLAIGAILANFIGTTGASMLLIRPMLRTNIERKNTKHIPIFFIFIVSNIGGCLTPLADPPLFLGYLRGVPFEWTLQLWQMYLTALGMILTIFYIYDRIAYSKETTGDVIFDKRTIEPLRIKGSFNFIFLVGVIVVIIISGYMGQRNINPTPWREIAMIILSILAYIVTPKDFREKNKFTFYPIIEVAVLFAGIFITMVPALLILRAKGGTLGINEPYQFFWMTGLLSSFLDNAPTYLTYLSLAQSVTEEMIKNGMNFATVQIQGGVVSEIFLKAISVGAVFMGANTYIGNGPNFMVKAIAEETGMKMPGFFGYMIYSVLILFPVFVVITFLFFNPFKI